MKPAPLVASNMIVFTLPPPSVGHILASISRPSTSCGAGFGAAALYNRRALNDHRNDE
jgi:hypothetical protein